MGAVMSGETDRLDQGQLGPGLRAARHGCATWLRDMAAACVGHDGDDSYPFINTGHSAGRVVCRLTWPGRRPTRARRGRVANVVAPRGVRPVT